MPNDVKIVVTGRDAGATKVLDDVTASSRATEKAQQKAAEASKLAAQVIKDAGGVVKEQSVRLVQAKLAESKASEDLVRVQAAARKGYLDEAQGAMATAAAMEKLARAKLQVAAIQAAPPPKPMTLLQAGHVLERREAASAIGAQGVLRERVNEHLGELGISESMGGMAAGVAAVSVGVGEIASKMREAVSESLEFGENMNRAAAKTGLSVETLSLLHYAAKTTGGDFESMSASVAKMDKTIGQATEGNKKSQAFLKALGLDATELAGREDGADVAFRRFAATLSATENPIRRVELATGLLGKAGAEQIPTLIELGENWDKYRDAAQRTGVLLDGPTAAALARTKERLEELKQSAFGAGLSFTQGLLPALDELMNVFSGPGADGMKAFKVLGEDIGRVFEFAAARLYDTASAAAMVASVAAGGPFTEIGKHLAVISRDYGQKSGKLYGAALTGKQPEPTRGDLAYEAGLGKGPTDPVLDALRKRNIARTGGFEGVGDLTGGSADQKRLKAMEAALDEEKTQFKVSIKFEYDYWTERQNVFAKGSAEYEAILKKRGALAQEGSRQVAAEIARFKAQQLALNKEQMTEDKAGRAMARDNARVEEERFDASNELYAIQQRTQMQLAEMAVREQIGRTLTEEAGAMQIAAIHAHAYDAELERLASKRKAIAENPLLSSGEVDQQRKVDELTRRIGELQAGRTIEAQQDTYAVKNADQSAVKGATDALQQFRMEAMDTAAQMNRLTTAIMSGVHAQLLNAVTGQKTDFNAVAAEAARGVADMALKKLEANAMNAARPLLDKVGLGGIFAAKRDGSSESSAVWVQPVGGDLTGSDGGMGSMSEMAKVLSKLHIPGLPEYKDSNGGDSGDDSGKGSGILGGLFGGLGKIFGGGGSDSGGDSGDGSGSGIMSAVTGMLGLGGGKSGKPTGSQADPFYVKTASSGGGGIPELDSLFGGGGGTDGSDGEGGISSLFSGLASLASGMSLPGFADGVQDFGGGPAIVGERGPELVNLPRGASVTPNHRLADLGGTRYEHHGDININAGDGTDREGLRSMVHSAVDTRMGMHLRGFAAARADAQSRVPSSRR